MRVSVTLLGLGQGNGRLYAWGFHVGVWEDDVGFGVIPMNQDQRMLVESRPAEQDLIEEKKKGTRKAE